MPEQAGFRQKLKGIFTMAIVSTYNNDKEGALWYSL